MTTLTTKKLVPIPKFLESLRSGRFKQGPYLVNKENKTLCAIGVWAYISNYLQLDQDYNIVKYDRNGFNDELWNSRESKFPQELDELWIKVMQWNDNMEKTFSEIADYIEKTVSEVCPEFLKL